MVVENEREDNMFALETRLLNNRPDSGSLNPFHPETHQGFDGLKIGELPLAGYQGLQWQPTGFEMDGGQNQDFVRTVLKDRFFHNPAVGYSLKENGMVVEYERVPQGRFKA